MYLHCCSTLFSRTVFNAELPNKGLKPTFVVLLPSSYNECCPIIMIKLKEIKNNKPCFTDSLINACEKKNNLYQ